MQTDLKAEGAVQLTPEERAEVTQKQQDHVKLAMSYKTNEQKMLEALLELLAIARRFAEGTVWNIGFDVVSPASTTTPPAHAKPAPKMFAGKPRASR